MRSGAAIACGTEEAAREELPGQLLLQWHVTERCNLRCSHCYQEDARTEELDWDGLLAVLVQFRALLATLTGRRGSAPTAHVTLTGGEPFVREDFSRLLRAVHAERARWSFAVLTNGTMLGEATADLLSELGVGFVQVSIEGSQATHDRIRGAGSHALAVEALRRLVRRRVPTMVSFTARVDNYREFPEVVRLGRRLGVGRVWTDRMIPLGHGDLDQVLSPEQTREYMSVLAAEAGRGGRTEVVAHRALQFAASGGRPYRCSAGRSLLTVLANGDICPCRRMPTVVGNVTRAPLGETYLRSPVLRALRGHAAAPVGCEACYYARTCSGGLKCLATAVHGSPFVADPGCWLARHRRPAPRAHPDALTACAGGHRDCAVPSEVG
jgi:radical SAM protein with 4Fe4S-binding SPASM domain